MNSGALRTSALAAAVALGIGTASAQPPSEGHMTPRGDHGITLFYTTGIPHEDLAGLKHPDVYGGELILFWHEFEPRDGEFDWDRLARDMDLWHAAGKKLDVRLSTAHIGPNYTPSWLFNNHQVRRIGRGVFEDFQNTKHRYALGAGTRVVTESSGSRSLEVRNAGPDPVVFLSHPQSNLLQGGATYSIQWDIEAITRAEGSVQIIGSDDALIEEIAFRADHDGWNVGNVERMIPESVNATVQWLAAPGSHFRIDNLNIIRVDDVVPFSRTDFEDGWSDWRPAGNARIVTSPDGGRSLKASAETVGFQPFLRNDPASFPLGEGDGVQVRMQVYSENDCRLRLRIASPDYMIGEIYDSIQEIRGGSSQRVVFYSPSFLPTDDCEILIGLDGPGEVLIDDIERRNWAALVTVFPDYFSPDFTRLWERALRSFADRFGDHPGLGIVSVGGFGRWEEVMLDEDVHGTLDAQWLSRGFTQEKYLDVVEHWMDCHRDLLPNAALRICLAYGLELVNDVDWVYRRVAQAAVRRGIGLKQNGLSEKYDTWNANTNTSYLYHRYRDNAAVSLTHETGGQVYRNLYDAHGYPLSLLNRSLANHTDYLFLYKPDIFGRNINRYFHTFAEQMRRTHPTVFHAWLGDYSLVNEHSAVPVRYRNNWFGLRQFDAPGAIPDAAIVADERVLRTNAANRAIVLDVDDRFQYHGMWGTELSVDYYDTPAGVFQVRVYDNTSDQWRSLGTVQRTGTEEFRRAYFHDTVWCRSRRNGGEDVHADIAIEEISGGELALRNVELQFVASTDWKRKVAWSNGPATSGVLAAPLLTHEVSIREIDTALFALSLRVFAPTLERNNLVARVHALDASTRRETLLVEKEYYLPGDGDELILPFAKPANGGSLRVELVALEGEVGWHVTDANEPAITLWTFATDASQKPLATHETKQLQEGQSLTRRIVVDQPIQGLGLYLGEVSETALATVGVSQVDILVSRELPEGWGSVPLLEQHRLEVGEAGFHWLALEPQPAGVLNVTVRAHWKDALIGIEGGELLVLPRALVPSRVQREPRPIDRRSHIAMHAPANAWTVAHGLETSPQSQEVIRYRVTSDAPSLILQADSIWANPRQCWVLHLQNETGANMARLFWAEQDEDFTPAKSVLLPLVPNDTYLRAYPVSMAGISGWSGTITRVKLQPVTGSMRHGHVAVGDTWIDEEITPLQLDLRDRLSHLWPASGIEKWERTAEGVSLTLSSAAARLHLPADDLNLDAEVGQVMLLRLKNASSATRARVGWHTLARPDLPPRRVFEDQLGPFIEFDIVPHDDEMREYVLDLSSHPDWRGHVVAFVIWPALSADTDQQVVIESVTITTGGEAVRGASR